MISLCHGPAGLLAAGIGERKDDFLYRGYEMCVFPDSLDTGANIDIGYIPGPMPGWWANVCASGRQDRQCRHHRQSA